MGYMGDGIFGHGYGTMAGQICPILALNAHNRARMAHVRWADPTLPTLPWHPELSNVAEMPATVPRMPPIHPFY